jgi:hypothetical protein
LCFFTMLLRYCKYCLFLLPLLVVGVWLSNCTWKRWDYFWQILVISFCKHSFALHYYLLPPYFNCCCRLLFVLCLIIHHIQNNGIIFVRVLVISFSKNSFALHYYLPLLYSNYCRHWFFVLCLIIYLIKKIKNIIYFLWFDLSLNKFEI